MRHRPPALLIILLLAPFLTRAQRVDYSGYLLKRSGDQFLFAGQAGHHYWIEKDPAAANRSERRGSGVPERHFIVMNERLQPEFEMTAPVNGFEKVYLVSGRTCFDQVFIQRTGNQTILSLLRFSEDGLTTYPIRTLDSLPSTVSAGQILLCRSADKSRLLLMAFENRTDESTRVYTLLFDENWTPLHRNVLNNPGFSQPCIQDDLIGLPGESFDNLPLKVSSQGDWVMTSLSTGSGRFVLVHGCAEGTSFAVNEMPVTNFFQMEDVAMDIDEEKGECAVGLLSRYRRTSLKHVRVSRYKLAEDQFVFDSAYQFNSLSARLYNTGLANESFVSIPGSGYMLFREYGRNGFTPIQAEETPVPGDPVFFSTLFSGGTPVSASLKEDSYVKKPGLQGMRSQFDRGNLSMFYFPAVSGDSTWSGLINTRQTSELNLPSLSYLIFPHRSRIYILYHAGQPGFTEPAVTTSLDRRGAETGDAVIFWKLNRDLDFQQAVRFSSDRIAVPFRNNQQPGFAVIRLGP